MEQHSYRSTQLIVATAYDGVCYVMGADIYETRNCFFAGIKTDVIPSYGEKAYSNEWANGIWYGEDGFRTKSHPYKAQWKSDRKGRRYQDASGWYAKNKSYVINGKTYRFNSVGYCTNP